MTHSVIEMTRAARRRSERVVRKSRETDQFQRIGVELSRATLAAWMVRLCSQGSAERCAPEALVRFCDDGRLPTRERESFGVSPIPPRGTGMCPPRD